MAIATPTKPNSTSEIQAQIAALETSQGTMVKAITDLTAISKASQELLEKASKPRYTGGRTPGALFNDGNAPHIRQGEDPMGSRPYSFAKALGYIREIVPDEEAKVELGLHALLAKHYCQANGYTRDRAKSLFIPLSSELMKTTIDNDVAHECKLLVKGGRPTDYDEVRYYAKRFGVSIEKTLSWIDESVGASLVPPPQQLELIELLRNNTALLLAGVSEIGMPPNGRAIWPRQTTAAQFVWLGEGQPGSPSDQGTGDLILTAKKAGAFTRVNNELFKFAGINVEQFVRNDLALVLGIGFDKAGLEGVGSNLSPKGLIQYTNITKHPASSSGATGDTFQPQDVYKMLGEVFGKNAKFTSWIMRPEMWAKLQAARWDTIQPGDAAGGFVWGLLRQATEESGIQRGADWHLGGYKLVQSTNVSNTRSKGGNNSLSYILGGDFPDCKMAMSGVVEISLSTQGDAVFLADQTMVRAINYCDIAPAHEASFDVCDQLLMS